MWSLLKNISVLTFLCFLTCCSKDYLNDNLTQDATPLGYSNIYVSPGWLTSDYLIKLPIAKDVDYEIISKPSWIRFDLLSGHLSNGEANVKCSAAINKSFNALGVYIDYLTVKADGKNYKVPVSYINEGNPKLQVQNTLALSYNSYYIPWLSLYNNGLGILMWKIKSMPDWLAVDTIKLKAYSNFIPPNTELNIPLLFKLNNVSFESMSGSIVLSTNDKDRSEVTINVTGDLGKPELFTRTDLINYSYSETTKDFTLVNVGTGILVWKFNNIPEWLVVAPSSGVYDIFTKHNNVVFSCDRTKLSPGLNSATVILKTNDNAHPLYSIKVTANAPGISKNMRAVDGNIEDAVFNKDANILYYVTSSPDKFTAYDVINKSVLNEIPLSKTPTCLAISEDWTKAAVGHNGYISALDLLNNTVASTFTVNCSVNDIAWAENDWFCYTQNELGPAGLHWINTVNGSLFDDPDQESLYGRSMIKKVPNQTYLIATRLSSFPSGFFAYDIATRREKSYAHMSLTNFWFSEDGDYIFDMGQNVYRTTSSTGSTDTFNAKIYSIGNINTGNSENYGLQYLYHNDNYLWILQYNSSSYNSSNNLYQIEDNNYTLVKKYDYELICQPDAQTTPFNLTANYVFTNKEGTEIAVLCKGVNNNFWVIQFIPVQ
jgi:hypothetical protein